MGRLQKLEKIIIKKKEKKTLWQKLKSYSTNNNNNNNKNNEKLKKKLFYMLSNALQEGCKIGKHVLVGTNSVMKCIERKEASVVCLCRDSPKTLFNSVVEGCALSSTPVVALPSTSAVEMANTFSLKKATAFAIPISKCFGNEEKSKSEKGEDDNSEDAENMKKMSDVDRICGALDGVRDAAIAMYTPNVIFKDDRGKC